MTEETSRFQSVLLTPQNVLKYWHLLEPEIEKALEHGIDELTAFDVCKQALDNKIQVWVAVDKNNEIVCTITTRFLTYPSTKVMQIITCTGSQGRYWDDFCEYHRTLEDYAKANGCSSLQVWGRKGWQRHLTKIKSRSGQDYQTLYYVYNMEI